MFIKHRKVFYLISLFLVLFGSLSLFIFNPTLGIDLVGGEILEVKTNVNVKNLLKDLNVKAVVFETKESYIIKGENLENLWQEVQRLDPKAIRLKQDFLSPSLSYELRKKAILMTILVLLAIGFYTAFAFRKLNQYFPLTILSFVVIITLFHDLLGSLGFYVLFSKFLNFDLDLKFIIALLTVAGFSVHDTIVVFDRLRENLLKHNSSRKTKNLDGLEEIFDQTIRQTLRRSIFTSLTTVLAILPLTILIPDLRGFLLAIQVGIIIGTYSSICLAAPFLFEYSK